jgi:hypothetical protein
VTRKCNKKTFYPQNYMMFSDGLISIHAKKLSHKK